MTRLTHFFLKTMWFYSYIFFRLSYSSDYYIIIIFLESVSLDYYILTLLYS